MDDPIHVNPRQIWSYKTSNRWWSEIVPTMTEQQFKNNFRLNRSTFSALLRCIGPYLQKMDTQLREAIPVEKRVALALYSLGSTSELRTVANLFGVGKSTSCVLLHEFCSTLVDKLFHKFVQFPSTNKAIEDTTTDFLIKCGYPLCIGAVDGSHISIKPPLGFESDYFNYKKHHLVILLAVVNSSLEFTYVNVGAPGRSNDSSVFNCSNLAEVIQHEIYSNHYMMLNGVKLQTHLVADSAFCLSPTLMKPYPDRPNMAKKYSLFNYRLSRCRCVVERAFGALKNRFRSLHKKMEYNLDNTITMIKATTILHNLCILEGDEIEIDWEVSQPIHKKPSSNAQTTVGGDVRDALTGYFLRNPL